MATAATAANRAAAAAKPAAKPTTTYSATAMAKGHPSAAAAHNAISQAIGKPASQTQQPVTLKSAISHALQNIMNINPYQQARSQTQQIIQAGLGPLQTQAAGITKDLATATGSFKGYSQAAGNRIQGLINQQGAGASSLENTLAQNAKANQDIINASGQTAQGLAGGYLGPEAANALAANRAYAGQMSGIQGQFLPSADEAGMTFLRGLAGAQTAAGMTGLANLQTAYGKQLAANKAAQQNLISTQTARIPDIASNLRQQKISDLLTAYNFGIRNLAQQQAGKRDWYNYQIQIQNAALRKYGIDVTASNDVVNQKLRRLEINNNYDLGKARNAETIANDQANQWLGNQRLQADKSHWAVQAKQAWQRIKNASKPGSKATPGQQVANLIDAQIAYYNYVTRTPGPQPNPNYDKNAAAGTPQSKKYITEVLPRNVAKLTVAGNMDKQGAALNAAMQMIDWGYVNIPTLNALRAQGVPINPAWTSRRASVLRQQAEARKGKPVSGSVTVPGVG